MIITSERNYTCAPCCRKATACYSFVITREIGARLICNPYLSECTVVCQMLFCLAQVTFNDPVQVYRVLSRALKRFTEDSTLRKKINVPFIRSNCKSCRTYARWQFVLPVMAGSHFAARNLNQMEILPPRAFLFGSSIMALYEKVADAPLPATCAHSCY